MTGEGGTYFACSRGQRRNTCEQCRRRPSAKQCDYPLKGPKGGTTCDRHLCDQCAVKQGPNRDYCGVHHRLAEQERAEAVPTPAATRRACFQCQSGFHEDCTARTWEGGCCDGGDPCM